KWHQESRKARAPLYPGRGAACCATFRHVQYEKASPDMSFGFFARARRVFRTKLREESHVAHRMRVPYHHRQPVNSDRLAGRTRQSMRQRADIINIELLRNVVAALRNLRQKAALLFRGIVQLREAVGDLHAGDVNLKSLRQ